MSAVVCTLRSKTTDQCTLNLVFGYDVSTKFSFTGDKQSTVYLSGYYQPAPEDMGSDDEFDGEMSEEEDSEEDEEAIITKAATKANASKMQIPEDDEDSEDDDEELEEDSVDEEFIKVRTICCNDVLDAQIIGFLFVFCIIENDPAEQSRWRR